jgi:hypothetical protein
MARNRKDIRVAPETKARLQALKRSDETWNDLLTRLAEYGELVDEVTDG